MQARWSIDALSKSDRAHTNKLQSCPPTGWMYVNSNHIFAERIETDAAEEMTLGGKRTVKSMNRLGVYNMRRERAETSTGLRFNIPS